MFDTLADLPSLSLRLSRATGLNLHIAAQTDSTNSQLLARADRLPMVYKASEISETPPVAWLALQQTAGRGRLGRNWNNANSAHPAPAFMASIGLQTSLPLANLGALPLHIGVAVAQYLQGLGLDVGLKWPNDIVLRSENNALTSLAKLGGILIETRTVKHTAPPTALHTTTAYTNRHLTPASEHTAIVIGLGLNWYAAPTVSGRSTACVADNIPAYALPDAESACAALLNAMHLGWQRTINQQRCEFAAFDVLAGQAITLHRTLHRTDNATLNPLSDTEAEAESAIIGIAQGVNAHGYLGVHTPQGLRFLHSGEVSLSLPSKPAL